MVELITEMLIYLGLAALLGLVLGYLVWGWGTSARIAAARSEGATSARTSVDGDVGMREQFEASKRDRLRLEAEVERLSADLADAEDKLAAQSAGVVGSADRSEAVRSLTPEPGRLRPEPAEPLAELSTVTYGSASHDHEPFFKRPKSRPEEIAEEFSESEVAEGSGADHESDGDTQTPSFLLDERPDEVDDLKRIKGVGTVMETVLNDKGIYLFHQVANLTEREIDWVNDAIEAFPGRIQRDRWVEQARDLYSEKYGRAHDAD
ncbi:MAG: hypothetical protein AAGD13_16635 [Pseudomonadota bacterium]